MLLPLPDGRGPSSRQRQGVTVLAAAVGRAGARPRDSDGKNDTVNDRRLNAA